MIGWKTHRRLAPNLPKTVPKRVIKQHTVADSNASRWWVSDIKGALLVPLLREYLLIWDLVDDFPLQPEMSDQHHWQLSKSGSYTSKPAYAAFILGTIQFAPWKRVRKTCHPDHLALAANSSSGLLLRPPLFGFFNLLWLLKKPKANQRS